MRRGCKAPGCPQGAAGFIIIVEQQARPQVRQRRLRLMQRQRFQWSLRSSAASPASYYRAASRLESLPAEELGVIGGLGIRVIHGYAAIGRQELAGVLQLRHRYAGLNGSHNLRRHADDQLGVGLGLQLNWKNLPRIGMSPRKGILSKVSVSRLSSKPPMTKL